MFGAPPPPARGSRAPGGAPGGGGRATSPPGPRPPGCASPLFRARVGDLLLPALRAFAPELILVSAGFDAHKRDPLAQMALDDDDFDWITRQVMAIADDVCDGRIVSVLEGGYSDAGLAGGCTAHVRALMAH
nr:hypothetical protein [uncultured Massilia sp.]